MNWTDLARCPRCRSPLSARGPRWRCTNPACLYAAAGFPVFDGVPALIDWPDSVVTEAQLNERGAASALPRPARGRLRRLLFGSNPVAARFAQRLPTELATRFTPPFRVLVVGGGAIGDGAEELYRHPYLETLGFDLYRSPHTQFLADAHRIPLADGGVDAVWIQAVLEHVLEPWRVVDEIHRALRPGGLVYAETPFLQHVHEGVFDFTRFTERGHRALFKRFRRLDSGIVHGPGTVALWHVDHLARALLRSKTAGQLAKAAGFWLRFLDRLCAPQFAADAASGVYFFGERSETVASPAELVSLWETG